MVASQDPHGEPVYERAAGCADRQSARERRVETLVRLSSVTKAIVCAAAMALVEYLEWMCDSLSHDPGQRLSCGLLHDVRALLVR